MQMDKGLGFDHEMGSAYADDLRKITWEHFQTLAKQYGFDGTAFSRSASKPSKKHSKRWRHDSGASGFPASPKGEWAERSIGRPTIFGNNRKRRHNMALILMLMLACSIPVAGASSALSQLSHRQYEQRVKDGYKGSYHDWQMASGVEKWGGR